MMILLPIGLLLIAALAIIILDRVRPKFGTSWLIASATSIVAWLFIFIMRLRLPTTFDVLSWSQDELNLMGHFSLLLDYNSWPYVLALITITLAIILTDAARTRYDSTPRSWSASLIIAAFGLLALQSGTSLTLMVTWVVVDLLELLYLLRLEGARRFYYQIIMSYGVRTASIMMLFFATSQGWQAVGNFDLTQIPQNAGFYFLLAAGLRLGVFPINLKLLQEPALRRGAGNIIRLAPVAASLSLLARLPSNIIPDYLINWTPVFLGTLAMTALYAAVRWLSASDEIEGRPFWIIAWAGLASASVLNGAPNASIAWGIALLLPGSLLFLYSPRVQRMNFLLYFGLIGLVGLPFTPVASGWVGLVANGLSFWTFLFILTHTIMVLGYLARALQPGGEAGALESWARLVFPLGLIIIIQAIATLGLIGWPGSFTLGIWWLSLVSNLLTITAIILVHRLGISPPYLHIPAKSKLGKVINRIYPRLQPLFNLEWLYQFTKQINQIISNILQMFSTILEGEGGILWAILLLVLLITILVGGGLN